LDFLDVVRPHELHAVFDPEAAWDYPADSDVMGHFGRLED